MAHGFNTDKSRVNVATSDDLNVLSGSTLKITHIDKTIPVPANGLNYVEFAVPEHTQAVIPVFLNSTTGSLIWSGGLTAYIQSTDSSETSIQKRLVIGSTKGIQLNVKVRIYIFYTTPATSIGTPATGGRD